MSARGRKSDRSKKRAGGSSGAPGAKDEQGKRKGAVTGTAESRRLGLLAFGVAFLLLFAGVAIAEGIGKPSLPSDDAVALIDMPDRDDVVITEDEFDRSMRQMAAQMQVGGVPEREDPQWGEVAQNTMLTELDVAWLKGEAEARGIEASQREIDQQLGLVATQEFNCPEDAEPFRCGEFRQFMQDTGFTREEVLELVEVGVLSNEILEQVDTEGIEPSERELRSYYEAFQEQFRVPASANVRIIQNEDRAPVVQAMRQLRQDSSPESWEQVAQEHSQDPLSSDQGGLREGVTEGMLPQPVQQAIDEAETGELLGPIETESDHFAIQVESRNPEQLQSFDEVREDLSEQVSQQLVASAQNDFFNTYTDRWASRTVCAEEYLNERCSNADGENVFLSAEVREQQEEEAADAAPVLADRSVWPKPPSTLPAPISPVTVNGTQIICHLAESPEGQDFPLMGTAPPQRPHPPGPTDDIGEVPEGVDPEQVPPTCGVTDPFAGFGGGSPLG